MKKKFDYAPDYVIEYELGKKVVSVEVFRKRYLKSVINKHKETGEFSPVPLKSAFAMILNGD